MNEAIENRSVRDVKSACEKVTNPLTIRLPASLPSPDPDVTNGLEFLIDDGTLLASACTALSDPPTADQLDAVDDAMGQLATDFRSFGTIMGRNGDLFVSAAEGG